MQREKALVRPLALVGTLSLALSTVVVGSACSKKEEPKPAAPTEVAKKEAPAVAPSEPQQVPCRGLAQAGSRTGPVAVRRRHAQAGAPRVRRRARLAMEDDRLRRPREQRLSQGPRADVAGRDAQAGHARRHEGRGQELGLERRGLQADHAVDRGVRRQVRSHARRRARRRRRRRHGRHRRGHARSGQWWRTSSARTARAEQVERRAARQAAQHVHPRDRAGRSRWQTATPRSTRRRASPTVSMRASRAATS